MRPIIAARILLVLASLLAVYLLYRDYGITYDEPVQSTYGDLVREYFLSGGVDRRSEEFLNLRYYGPLTDLLPAFVHPANDLTKYEVRHFLCGLFAVLTLVATWSFARLMPGSLVAPFAFLGLALMPRFAGHAFDNLKDVPFASAIAVFVAVAASMNLKRDFRLSRVIACGLAAGFVLCVRPGGFLLMLGILVAFSFLADLTLGPGPRSRPGSLTVRLVIIIAIGWLLMVLPWPYAHRGPLWHPLEAMALSLSFPWTTDILFDGAVVRSVSPALTW